VIVDSAHRLACVPPFDFVVTITRFVSYTTCGHPVTTSTAVAPLLLNVHCTVPVAASRPYTLLFVALEFFVPTITRSPVNCAWNVASDALPYCTVTRDPIVVPSTGDSHVTAPLFRSMAATVPELVPTIAYQPAPLMSVSTAPPVTVFVFRGGVQTRVPSVVVVSTTPPPMPPQSTPPIPSTVGSAIPAVLEV